LDTPESDIAKISSQYGDTGAHPTSMEGTQRLKPSKIESLEFFDEIKE